MTRFEKLKSMSVQQLAEIICGNCSHCEICPLAVFDSGLFDYFCPIPTGQEVEALVKWLEEEYEDGNN